MNIVIIGSGFGGLAVALRCLSKGHKVTIFEKLKIPGGKASWFEKDGYIFDFVPSIITAPWLLEELFKLFNKNTSGYYELVKLEQLFKLYFNNRNIFTYSEENILREIKKFNLNDINGYKLFNKITDRIFLETFSFLDNPFLTPGSILKTLPKYLKLKAYKPIYKFVSEFFQNEYLRIAFTIQPLYLLGANPFRASCIYTFLYQLEKKWGAWYAKGGTNTIIKGLCKLFQENGGKIYYNSEVTKILCKKKKGKPKAIGIKINNKEKIEADVVICNSDISYTYRNLINKEYRKKYSDLKINSFKYGNSFFIIYLGLKRKYDNIPQHAIIFNRLYHQFFEDVFIHYKVPEEFILYIHRPTAIGETVAPPNKDCMYILSPVPNLKSQTDWSNFGERYKNLILEFLEYSYMPELRENIETEFFITPEDFKDKHNSFLGSAFLYECTLFKSIYFRPHNKSEDIENLYFVGAGTHPGAGIPMVISSAKIVDRLIEKDFKK